MFLSRLHFRTLRVLWQFADDRPAFRSYYYFRSPVRLRFSPVLLFLLAGAATCREPHRFHLSATVRAHFLASTLPFARASML